MPLPLLSAAICFVRAHDLKLSDLAYTSSFTRIFGACKPGPLIDAKSFGGFGVAANMQKIGGIMNYWKGKTVLVTGGKGFLGRHIVASLRDKGCDDVIVVRSKEYDLTIEGEVQRLFDACDIDVVFHLAGLVGGILPNKERPAEFFYQNLMMGTLMLHHSWLNGVQKFIAAGAGCGYPEKADLPLKERDFWEGFPQRESAPYSLAKRLLSIQSLAYHQQYGFTSIICIPGNLYGPWDNFNLNDAHVIPAVVRKFVDAEQSGASSVEIWGSGKPTRDFVFAADVAMGMLRAAEVYDKNEVVNISSGVETSILEVCHHMTEITGYGGAIVHDRSKPDGQLRRCFDITKAKQDLGFTADTDIVTGLRETTDWFTRNYLNPEVRR